MKPSQSTVCEEHQIKALGSITTKGSQRKSFRKNFINRFTELDAYPLPRIDEQINQLAKCRIFSTLDLKSAYYQIPLHPDDRVFTAFEAAGQLYQYRRLPFGVTNGVAAFQRIIDKIIASNKYLLVVVDEFSRFPFAFPCKDTTTASTVNALSSLFSLMGFPSYVHSDRGASFISKEFKDYMHSRGIATSNSTPYHPTGNSQCERFNQTIWKTVSLMLKGRLLSPMQWEEVLPQKTK